jgi:hypothetical protein
MVRFLAKEVLPSTCHYMSVALYVDRANDGVVIVLPALAKTPINKAFDRY